MPRQPGAGAAEPFRSPLRRMPARRMRERPHGADDARRALERRMHLRRPTAHRRSPGVLRARRHVAGRRREMDVPASQSHAVALQACGRPPGVPAAPDAPGVRWVSRRSGRPCPSGRAMDLLTFRPPWCSGRGMHVPVFRTRLPLRASMGLPAFRPPWCAGRGMDLLAFRPPLARRAGDGPSGMQRPPGRSRCGRRWHPPSSRRPPCRAPSPSASGRHGHPPRAKTRHRGAADMRWDLRHSDRAPRRSRRGIFGVQTRRRSR